MKPTEYDFKIIKVVSAFRILAKEKQSNIAQVLNITQSEYSRIERGERALTLGHLYLITQYLKVSLVQVLVFADACHSVNTELPSLSLLLEKFVQVIDERKSITAFSKTELEFVLAHITDLKRKSAQA